MPNPGAPSLQDIFSGNAPTAPTQTSSPSLPGKPSLGQIFTPGVFNPKPVSTSPFNPNTPPDQAAAQLRAEAAKNPANNANAVQLPVNKDGTASNETTSVVGNLFGNTKIENGRLVPNVQGVIPQGIQQYGQNVKNSVVENAQNLKTDYTTGVKSGTTAGAAQGALRGTSDIISAITSPISEAIKPAVNFDANALQNNKTFSSVANSGAGNVVANAQDKVNQFTQAHPDLTKNAGAAFNVASVMAGGNDTPGFVKNSFEDVGSSALDKVKPGLDTVKNVATDIGNKIADTNAIINANAAADVATKAKQSTWDMIKPNLTPTEQADAVKAGAIKTKGILGTVTQVPQGTDLKMIEAAQPYVSNAKNAIEAVSNMQDGIANEATQLRSNLKSTGATYTKSQLQGAFNKIEADPNLISDQVLAKKAELLQQKALEFAGNGGTLDKLQDVNTKLDAYIKKYYPNLYSSDTLTPLRQAVRDVRNAVKVTISSRLPVDSQYLPSLERQSLLYDAIDNTASKVGKVGSNKVSQFIKNNPVTSNILKGGLRATGIGAAIDILHP